MWAPIDFQSIVVVAFAAAGIRYQHKTTHVSMNRRPYCNGCTIKNMVPDPLTRPCTPAKRDQPRDCGASLLLVDVRAPRRAATAVHHYS
jgi:hypothetical protein